MRKSTDTTLRYLTLLQLLPVRPQKKTTIQLRDELITRNPDYEVDIRTVQRDLEKLSVDFPLMSESAGRANCWFWADRNAMLEIPGMNPATALIFHFASEYLRPLLPQSALGFLEPYFRRSATVLGQTSLAKWTRKVRAIHRSPTFQPPTIAENIQNVVYTALLRDYRFETHYKNRGKKKAELYKVNPLGLVIKDGVIYLVATLWDYEDIRQLALHRMSRPLLLVESVKRPKGFDLNKYIEDEQGFAYPLSPKLIKLKVFFDAGAAQHLVETPLSKYQKLTPQEDGHVLLQVTIADTAELRWWLMGFGDLIEVLSPPSLRLEFSNLARRLARKYSNSV